MRSALEAIDGVEVKDVKKGSAVVSSVATVSDEQLIKAVKAAGFGAQVDP